MPYQPWPTAEGFRNISKGMPASANGYYKWLYYPLVQCGCVLVGGATRFPWRAKARWLACHSLTQT